MPRSRARHRTAPWSRSSCRRAWGEPARPRPGASSRPTACSPRRGPISDRLGAVIRHGRPWTRWAGGATGRGRLRSGYRRATSSGCTWTTGIPARPAGLQQRRDHLRHHAEHPVMVLRRAHEHPELFRHRRRTRKAEVPAVQLDQRRPGHVQRPRVVIRPFGWRDGTAQYWRTGSLIVMASSGGDGFAG